VALVVFASLLVLSYWDWRAYEAAHVRLSQAQANIDKVSELADLLRDAELAEREYLLGGGPEFLRRCEAALARIPGQISVIERSNSPEWDSAAKATLVGRFNAAIESIRGTLHQRSGASAGSRGFSQAALLSARQLIASQRARIDNEHQTEYLTEKSVRGWALGGTLLLFLLLTGASIHMPVLIRGLRLAEQRYRLLFDTNPQPMWIYDQTTLGFLAVNHAAVRRYGYTPEEFRGMTLRDIRPPEDLDRLLEAVRLPATDLHSAGPWRHRRRDGTILIVEIIEHPITFDGRLAALAMPRDITEQQASESALQQSRERLQLVLDAANEGLWDWNVTSGEGYFGPRFCKILGYEPDELASDHESWRKLVHPADLEPLAAKRAEQIRQNAGAFVIEYRMRKKSGEYIWVESRGKVIASAADGTPARIVGMITDINERKLAEGEFQQAQRLETVGRLAGGVAHDFNNLLTVINGYSEMALAGIESNSRLYEDVKEIRAAGERAAGLTQQLLAFSRKQLLQPTVININYTVSEVDKMLRRLIGEQITLTTRLAADLGNIRADAGQLQQIIVNLAVNSRDAMPRGGTLTIETANVTFEENQRVLHPEVRPGPHVLLAISDNGAGMPPRVREHIFEPFFTTKAKGAGTGLGLSIVHGIVKQSGGWILVYSETGVGSTFKVYFPRVDQSVTIAGQIHTGNLYGTETILVVEDQIEVRNFVETALRSYGYTVHTCVDGSDALRFAAQFEGPIHMLVTDVIMPGMNGVALAGLLTERRPGLRILLMSGYTDNAIPGSATIDDEISYLQKPFSPSQLAAKVREVLI
jgi:PAS domain S-box-containing protein